MGSQGNGVAMKLDIGSVFASAWEMIKARVWLLIGMWLVFFVIQLVYTAVVGGILGGTMFAFGAAGAGMDDPGALLGGLGIGAILLSFVFYIGYFVIAFGGQAASAILGSPLEQPNFSDALRNGLKAGLTFLGVLVLLGIVYFVFFLGYSLLTLILSFLGDLGAFLAVLLFVPAFIYLSLRFAVIMPVVAVDKVFNPIAAIRRTWDVTAGNVLGIFIVVVATIVLALVLLGLPFMIIFGGLGLAAFGAGGGTDAGTALAAVGSIIGAFVLLAPLYIVYSIVSVVINACLHAELTDTQAEELADTFE